MKSLMKVTLGLAVLLLAGTAFGQISIGIQIGAPPPPKVLKVRPKAPGPDYFWVEGYWYPVGKKYVWHQGYWTRPPYEGARWVPPHHDGKMYYAGYWDGSKGRIEHDHKFDKDKDRDYRRPH